MDRNYDPVAIGDIIEIVVMLIKKKLLKAQKKLRELEIMYQNAIYVCIS